MIQLPKSKTIVDKTMVINFYLVDVTIPAPFTSKHLGVRIVYYNGDEWTYIQEDARVLWQYLHGVPLPEPSKKPALDIAAAPEERLGLAISNEELDDMFSSFLDNQE